MLSGSALAVVFASSGGSLPGPIERVLSSLSVWLDPLLLLEREQEVIASAAAVFERERDPASIPEVRAAQLAGQRLHAEVAYLRRINAQSLREVTSATQQLALARNELESIQQTKSWKLTKPLRRGRRSPLCHPSQSRYALPRPRARAQHPFRKTHAP